MLSLSLKSKVGVGILLLLVIPLSVGGQFVEPPETLEEAEEQGKAFLSVLMQEVEKIWREEVLPVWKKMWELVVRIYQNTLGPFVGTIIDEIGSAIGTSLKEEIAKEKQEIEKDLADHASTAGRSLWERIWGALRGKE